MEPKPLGAQLWVCVPFHIATYLLGYALTSGAVCQSDDGLEPTASLSKGRLNKRQLSLESGHIMYIQIRSTGFYSKSRRHGYNLYALV